MTTRIFQLLLLTAAAAVVCVADPSFTFSTVPLSGDISGSPGQTIGWGYSITNNDSTDYLVLTNLDAGTFLNGSAAGLFDFPILAPGQTVTESFDAALSQGLYELTWDPGAPDGFENSGQFTVTADWYDGDPFGTGSPIDGLTGVMASQPYSATVVAAKVAAPEPSGFSILFACLSAIPAARLIRRRSDRFRS